MPEPLPCIQCSLVHGEGECVYRAPMMLCARCRYWPVRGYATCEQCKRTPERKLDR